MSKTETVDTAVVIDEKELVKMLDKVVPEDKPEDKKPAEATEVATAVLTKTAKETVKDTASEPLQKALEVSNVLNEVVEIIGLHVDHALKSFEGSIKASADRDLKTVKAILALAKSIDDLKEDVKKFGEQPSKDKPKSEKTDVVLKPAEKAADGEVKAPSRKMILDGLQIMHKSADDLNEKNKLTHAITKFESTREISDEHLFLATQAYKKQPGLS